jgi:energy-converting hydrogenase Eha subunit H
MEGATAQAMKTVNLVSQELETQSLNAIVAGFSFAAAMSWMDLVRWFTTLLSIAVYLVISTISTRVSKPAQPVYAITR